MESQKVIIAHLHNNSRCIIALKDLAEGSEVCSLVQDGPVQSTPNLYSVQTGKDTHINPGSYLKFCNHSCQPTTRFDFSTWTLVATRKISRGEEVTFNYNTSEFKMAAPFECTCKGANLGHQVKGFHFLSREEKAKLLPFVSPAVSELEEDSK